MSVRSIWPKVSLGEICEFKYGRSLPANSRVPGPFVVYGSNGAVGSHSKGLTSGPTIVIGRKGSFGEINYSDAPCWPIDTTYYIDSGATRCDLRWLTHRLSSLGLTSLNRAAAIPGLNREDAYRRTLLLPPLADQQRIAQVLDHVGTLRAKRREAIALLGDLPQSHFLDMFGDPVVNSQQWDSAPLTEACYCYSGGTPSKGVASNWTGDVPWISAKDMKARDLFASRDMINRSVTETTSLKLLPADTVAIVVRGMILAHSFPVCVMRIPAAVNQDLKALMPRSDLNAQFLAACMRAQESHALAQVSAAAHGTTRLDARGLSRLRVILPPRNLQDRFAASILACERLRNSHQAHLAELDALFASLQHRLFRGEPWPETPARAA